MMTALTAKGSINRPANSRKGNGGLFRIWQQAVLLAMMSETRQVVGDMLACNCLLVMVADAVYSNEFVDFYYGDDGWMYGFAL